MTKLRQRMIEDMQLRGFSARTQECYVRSVAQLAEHFHRSPDQLNEEELRQYFLYLANGTGMFSATRRNDVGHMVRRFRSIEERPDSGALAGV
jgi:hypothetical protein